MTKLEQINVLSKQISDIKCDIIKDTIEELNDKYDELIGTYYKDPYNPYFIHIERIEYIMEDFTNKIVPLFIGTKLINYSESKEIRVFSDRDFLPNLFVQISIYKFVEVLNEICNYYREKIDPFYGE